MRLDRGQIEVVDDALVAVLRQKTGAERLAIANGMFVSARRMLTCHLHAEHPEWDAQRVSREVAKRLSHGSI